MNSATQSKINWTAGVMAVVNILIIIYVVSAAYEVPISTLVNTFGSALIIIFRTWFTGGKE